MYKIHAIHENLLLCNEQGYLKTTYKKTSEIDWSLEGVFKEGGISENTITLNKMEIHGKVLKISHLLITVT